MKKRNIYELTIKILGLISACEVILFIRKLSEYWVFISIDKSHERNEGESFYIYYCITEIIIFLIISYILIFKSKNIINKLPETIETDIDISFDKKDFFEIIIKTLGLIVIIWTLPELIIEVKKYFDFKLNEIRPNFRQNEPLIFNFTKIILGFVVIKFAKNISNIANK